VFALAHGPTFVPDQTRSVGGFQIGISVATVSIELLPTILKPISKKPKICFKQVYPHFYEVLLKRFF
jgi:hypothetical protein